MLAAGSRLGPYEIVGPLGAGGMGEVFRARDTRLGRDVAIKVMPQHLASTPEQRQRFEREARAVSALNHPNICTLFDIGREGDTDFLVMELVDGETLAARIERGALPFDQTLRIGIEIADALDRAHKSGIIHRDLKPGNIMLTKSGAKLLDFGLARETALAAAPGNLSQTPTLTGPLTAQGTIVGTFQYMAPEQLDGNEADARTDLFSFGSVLYEMASGKKAFSGKSQASLIASIISSEPPPVSTVAPMTPPAFDRAVRQCMAKDPDDRWQSASDLKRELQWIRDAGSQAGVAAPVVAKRRNRERLGWITALAVVVLAAAALALAPRFMRRDDGVRVVRFSLEAPAGLNLVGTEPSSNVLSPDGTMLVFTPSDSTGIARLWVRPLSSLAARMLPGTESARYPFWSPDGHSIGFFAEGKLKRIPVDGGRPQVLCDAQDARGGTWNREGVILFSPSPQSGVFRVPASGGVAVPATTPDTAHRQLGHRWPRFLPDGRHFLYMSIPAREGQFDTFMGSLDGKPAKLVGSSDCALVYAPPGYVLLVRNETLLAQKFDPTSGATHGEPVSLGDLPNPGGQLGEPRALASENGTLVFGNVSPLETHLVWADRTGKQLGVVPMAPGPYTNVNASPDGRRAVLMRSDPQTGLDLWMTDLARGTATRFTSEPGNEIFSTWSADGSRLYFASNRNGPYNIYSRPVVGVGQEEVVLQSEQLKKWPLSISSDGRYLLYVVGDPKTGADLWILPLTGDRKPTPYLNSRFDEDGGDISPDGRWCIYFSNESGREEAYVQPFPTPGAKTQVSLDGAVWGHWSRDGRELYFGTPDGKLMVSDVQTKSDFVFSAPRLLYRLPRESLDLTDCGDRWLWVMPVHAPRPPTLTVVLNWAAELKNK